MTTVYFIDGQLEYRDAKTARAKLRKMGLTVRNAQKKGQDYYFTIFKPDGAVSTAVRPRRAPKTQTVQNLREDGTVSLKEIEIPVLQTKDREIKHLPVVGDQLQPDDILVNFVPNIDLTVDFRGIHEIVIPAPYISRIETKFLGFYSQESGGLSSYRILPQKIYDVMR